MRASPITPTIVVQTGLADPFAVVTEVDTSAHRILARPVGASRGLIDDRNLGRRARGPGR